MNKENKQLITNVDKSLTKRDYKFIELIGKGLKISEAYVLAGFKGKNPQAPYQLNHKLKGRIAEIAEANGFSKQKLMVEFNKLIDLPLEETKLTVTFREKLQLLRQLARCLPDAIERKESFSRFVIVNNVVPQVDRPTIVDTALSEQSIDTNND